MFTCRAHCVRGDGGVRARTLGRHLRRFVGANGFAVARNANRCPRDGGPPVGFARRARRQCGGAGLGLARRRRRARGPAGVGRPGEDVPGRRRRHRARRVVAGRRRRRGPHPRRGALRSRTGAYGLPRRRVRGRRPDLRPAGERRVVARPLRFPLHAAARRARRHGAGDGQQGLRRPAAAGGLAGGPGGVGRRSRQHRGRGVRPRRGPVRGRHGRTGVRGGRRGGRADRGDIRASAAAGDPRPKRRRAKGGAAQLVME